MAKIALLLICGWSVGFVSSFSLNFNKTRMMRPNVKPSKYVYEADKDVTSDIQHYGEESTIAISFTTESLTDICNSSDLDEYAFLRRKRSVHHRLTTTVIPDTMDLSELSEEFRNCLATTVEPECYVLFPNGSVYVPLYKMLFDKSNYVINEGLLFVCPDFFDIMQEKFSSAIGTVTIVCVAISTIFIILHVAMFLLVEKLRNLPGYCLFSLCISLLMAYMNFFIQISISDQADCKVIGLLLMYSFLSSFFWMNVISFDVWHSIRQATAKLLLSSGRSILFRFSLYSSYAWGMPLLILIIALIVDNASEDVEYHLVFSSNTCWFQYRQALLVYFALPLFLVLTLNTFFFFSSFHMIRKSRSDSGSQESYDLRSQLFLTLRLGTAMGLMWIFGVIDAVTDQVWISYLQSACNALQGVFIFFSFNFNTRTKKACKEAIKKKKSSIMSLTSPFQTKKFSQ